MHDLIRMVLVHPPTPSAGARLPSGSSPRPSFCQWILAKRVYSITDSRARSNPYCFFFGNVSTHEAARQFIRGIRPDRRSVGSAEERRGLVVVGEVEGLGGDELWLMADSTILPPVKVTMVPKRFWRTSRLAASPRRVARMRS